MKLIRSMCLSLCHSLCLALAAVAHAHAAAPAPHLRPRRRPLLLQTPNLQRQRPKHLRQLIWRKATQAARSPEQSAMFRQPIRKVGVTLADTANQVGQNKIAINFVWTLVTGFLVMFMQAGFAMVESGLCRVKNANHTYMMNFFVYTAGLFSYWLVGFAIQMGGAAGNGNLGGLQSLTPEHTMSLFGKTWGLFGGSGILPVRSHL